MDLSSLRSLVRNLNFSAHGCDITVDVDPDPIATRGIWLSPETDDHPAGFELRRRERSYVLAVPLLEVPHATIVHAPLPPFATDLVGPPISPGEILRWQVDGFAGVESDHLRIRLVLAPLEAT